MDTDEIVQRLVRERPGKDFLTFDYDTKAVPVGPGMYKSSGISASYMIVGRDERIVVNTGTGGEARHHKRLFDEISTAPTLYIVTTQAHTDHVGGVAHFRESGTEYIAQANNAEFQRLDAQLAGLRRRFGAPWFSKIRESARRLGEIDAEHSAAASSAAPGERVDLGPLQDRPVPDTTFDDHLQVSVAGVELELLSTPGGETIDSCIVWHADSSTCLIGNLLGPLFPHFPNFNTLRGDRYRDPARYLTSLNRLRALEADTILTGRGTPLTGRATLDAVLGRLHDAVEYVYETTMAAITDGQDLAEIMATVRLPDSLYVGQAYGRVTWAVRAIWESNVGWFRQRSTTELYPPDNSAVQRTLVALAGSDQVAAQAREEFNHRRPLTAIGLAEAVLLQDATHPGAREVLRDAHILLLKEDGHDNFWFDGWLQAQITELGTQVAH
jgi:glyoxylase-like metal-dependent hydrolase (beta-lactamase superfamily II)